MFSLYVEPCANHPRDDQFWNHSLESPAGPVGVAAAMQREPFDGLGKGVAAFQGFEQGKSIASQDV